MSTPPSEAGPFSSAANEAAPPAAVDTKPPPALPPSTGGRRSDVCALPTPATAAAGRALATPLAGDLQRTLSRRLRHRILGRGQTGRQPRLGNGTTARTARRGSPGRTRTPLPPAPLQLPSRGQ